MRQTSPESVHRPAPKEILRLAEFEDRARACLPVAAYEYLAPGAADENTVRWNLDTAPATIDALREVAERIAGRVPVLVDGGIRRGTDIVKALAYGASAVLVGRPYCYGLAVAGADGVSRVIEILRIELAMTMQLIGCRSLEELNSSVLWSSQR